MTTGLKVWLWIVLVVNAIAGVGAIMTALLVPLMWIVVVAEALVVAGAAMLLFPRKKMGFYLICGGTVIGFLMNVVLGQGIVSSLASAVISVLIVWLLIKNTWYEFQ